jgi:predicted Zn-dependent peptidase
VDTTMEVMMREVRRMIDEPVPDEELKNKINVFITRYYLSNETNEAQANLLARYELAGAGYMETQKIIDYFQKVTPTDIQDVCSQNMNNIQYVLLGNPDRIDCANFAF